jgi:hypothetical protein
MSSKPAMIDAIAHNGQITQDQAAQVFDLYRKEKIVKFNAHDGYSVTHGAFLDRDVITRAVNSIGAK